MARRAWSLADELATLAQAVEAARGLADNQCQPSVSLGPTIAAEEALSGSLALVASRLRDLWRVVRSEVDPRLVWASHNGVEPDVESATLDVIIRAWGPKRRVVEARRALAQAEDELARRRR
jgi:hypothetical protein